MPEAEEQKPKRGVHRSPNYPAFSLREAIEKARAVYDSEKRSFSTPEVIAKLLGYAQAVGGPGGRALSALRQYGLLEESGDKAKISDLAFILVNYPPDSPERIQAIKKAVRKPALFNELLNEYKDSLPSDATLHSNLLRRGFNPSVIDDVLKSFRDTVELDASQDVSYAPLQVGDYVQWQSSGVDQFDQPEPILRLSEDGKFAFFDGSNAGIPLEQLSKANPPEESEGGKGKPFIVRRPVPKPGMNNDVFTLDEGEVVLQWPSRMSAESYEDFKDWLELITRKAKRAVEKGPETPDSK